jgi:hypothetical protein
MNRREAAWQLSKTYYRQKRTALAEHYRQRADHRRRQHRLICISFLLARRGNSAARY